VFGLERKGCSPSAECAVRILHTCYTYWPHADGVAVVMQRVSEGLAARGHEVTADAALAHRSAAQLDLVGMMHQAVEDRTRKGGVPKALLPAVQRRRARGPCTQPCTLPGGRALAYPERAMRCVKLEYYPCLRRCGIARWGRAAQHAQAT